MHHSPRNRRIQILIAGVLTITAGMVHAGQDTEKVVRLVTLDVSDNLYLLRGNDTNILALVAETGIVLVDTLGQGWGPAIRAALNNITALPVTTIINTHAHEAHSGGNLEFQSVVEILAHENTKSQMERMEIFQGPNARFLPTETFRESMTLLDDIDRIELHHFGVAHTNGDVVVVFPEKGIAYLGDLFARTGVPRVDRNLGGSGLAYPNTLQQTLNEIEYFTEFVRGPEIRTFDRVVPGHQVPPDDTPLLSWFTWVDLETYVNFTKSLVEVVEGSKSTGDTVDEAVVVVEALVNQYPGYVSDGSEAIIETIFSELED